MRWQRWPAPKTRDVIVHYHIFKNAGTSIDASLQASFGARWLSYDRSADWVNVTEADLVGLIGSGAGLRAVSSHQLRWPHPVTARLRTYPIVFLRHPIDRVGSIYSYLRRIGDPRIAGRSLGETVDWLLGPQGNIVAESFQTLFLSDDTELVATDSARTRVSTRHFDEAARRLGTLPVVGVVERFDGSVRRLNAWLGPVFPELRLAGVRHNSSRDTSRTLQERLRDMADVLGGDRYARLVRANEADLELYEMVTTSGAFAAR